MRALSFLLLAACAAPVSAQTTLPIRVADAPMQHVVSPGKAYSYTLNIGANFFVRGYADQKTADVVVRVFDPNGRAMGVFDIPARGPENFRFTSEIAGEHRIEVSAFQNDSGSYVMKLERAEPVATRAAARVDQLMSDYSRTSPGGVVAVLRGGKVEFVRAYGMANLEYDVPITPQTVFHMASVSKQFTAFAILMLAQQGKLSVDDDIRKHLPELPDFGTPITIRQLANHTSGLRDQWSLWQLSGGRMDDVITQADLLALVRRQRELNFAPGTEFLYSNTGYMLLSEIVARVSGQPFGAWLKQNIFDPLGMTHTQIFDDHERIVKGRAYSYHRAPDGGWAKSVLSYANRGATSLFSTAGDLALWLDNFKTGKVGGRALVMQLREPGRLANGDSIPYAFGILNGEYRGLKSIGHNGADAGYRTLVTYYPDLDAGVIALSNDGGFDIPGIDRGVAEAFFSDRMQPRAPRPAPAPQPAAAATWQPDEAALQAYVGAYYSPELDVGYQVVLQNGRLLVRQRRGPETTLRPSQPDSFLANGNSLRFERGADGRVTGLRVSNGRVRNLLFERR